MRRRLQLFDSFGLRHAVKSPGQPVIVANKALKHISAPISTLERKVVLKENFLAGSAARISSKNQVD